MICNHPAQRALMQLIQSYRSQTGKTPETISVGRVEYAICKHWMMRIFPQITLEHDVRLDDEGPTRRVDPLDVN